jgi:hypothetical protein
MDIGAPPMQHHVPRSSPQDVGQKVMEGWLNLGGAQSAFGPNFSTNWSTMLFGVGGVGAERR